MSSVFAIDTTKDSDVNLIDANQITAIPSIEEGDAGIILKKDGSFQVFNCHATIDAKNMTERQIEQGKQLLGLAAAVKLPELMQVLLDVANNPDVFKRAVELPRQQ